MVDVAVDSAALIAATAKMQTAARMVAQAGVLDYISESVIGSPEVAAALDEVVLEHGIRAEVVGASVHALGRRPAAAANSFTALDRSVAF